MGTETWSDHKIEKQFNLAVYIGRFQPVHQGHLQNILLGTKLAHKLLVIVGSYSLQRTTKNPFSFGERKRMILECRNCTAHNIKVEPIADDPSDAVWANEVDDIVKKYEQDDSKIALIGDKTDPDSTYLNQLLNWPVFGVESAEGVHASAIRFILYTSKNLDPIQPMVPEATFRFLNEFRKSDATQSEWSSLSSKFMNEQGILLCVN